MDKIDVNPTAEAMEAAADRMRQAADELLRLSKRMKQSGDLIHVSEGVSVVVNCIANCRLDLFITRPIWELQSKKCA